MRLNQKREKNYKKISRGRKTARKSTAAEKLQENPPKREKNCEKIYRGGKTARKSAKKTREKLQENLSRHQETINARVLKMGGDLQQDRFNVAYAGDSFQSLSEMASLFLGCAKFVLIKHGGK